MAIEMTGSVNSYAARDITGSRQLVSKRQRMSEYARELAKLAPSVEVRIGDSFPKTRTGKTLTIHPGLLNKMQHDPEQEQATKEMIQGVEFLTKWLDGLYKATGRTLVFRHSYIDAAFAPAFFYSSQCFCHFLHRNRHGWRKCRL